MLVVTPIDAKGLRAEGVLFYPRNVYFIILSEYACGRSIQTQRALRFNERTGVFKYASCAPQTICRLQCLPTKLPAMRQVGARKPQKSESDGCLHTQMSGGDDRCRRQTTNAVVECGICGALGIGCHICTARRTDLPLLRLSSVRCIAYVVFIASIICMVLIASIAFCRHILELPLLCLLNPSVTLSLIPIQSSPPLLVDYEMPKLRERRIHALTQVSGGDNGFRRPTPILELECGSSGALGVGWRCASRRAGRALPKVLSVGCPVCVVRIASNICMVGNGPIACCCHMMEFPPESLVLKQSSVLLLIDCGQRNGQVFTDHRGIDGVRGWTPHVRLAACHQHRHSAARWRHASLSRFDSTRGFPGEGPPMPSPRRLLPFDDGVLRQAVGEADSGNAALAMQLLIDRRGPRWTSHPNGAARQRCMQWYRIMANRSAAEVVTREQWQSLTARRRHNRFDARRVRPRAHGHGTGQRSASEADSDDNADDDMVDVGPMEAAAEMQTAGDRAWRSGQFEDPLSPQGRSWQENEAETLHVQASGYDGDREDASSMAGGDRRERDCEGGNASDEDISANEVGRHGRGRQHRCVVGDDDDSGTLADTQSTSTHAHRVVALDGGGVRRGQLEISSTDCCVVCMNVVLLESNMHLIGFDTCSHVLCLFCAARVSARGHGCPSRCPPCQRFVAVDLRPGILRNPTTWSMDEMAAFASCTRCAGNITEDEDTRIYCRGCMCAYHIGCLSPEEHHRMQEGITCSACELECIRCEDECQLCRAVSSSSSTAVFVHFGCHHGYCLECITNWVQPTHRTFENNGRGAFSCPACRHVIVNVQRVTSVGWTPPDVHASELCQEMSADCLRQRSNCLVCRRRELRGE